MFSYLSKVLFSGFFQFKANFVDGQNNSKYCDVPPLRTAKMKELRSLADISLKHDYMHYYLWVASREDAKHNTRWNFNWVKKYNTISGFSPLLHTVMYSDNPSGML